MLVLRRASTTDSHWSNSGRQRSIPCAMWPSSVAVQPDPQPHRSGACRGPGRHARTIRLRHGPQRGNPVAARATAPGSAGGVGCIPRAGTCASPAVASVWGDPQLHEAHFIFSPYGHGWHIDRRCFDEGLATAARQAGARVMRGARAVSCHSDASPTWRIESISSGRRQRLQSAFLVDATGRTSATARAQPATRISYDCLVGSSAHSPTDVQSITRIIERS